MPQSNEKKAKEKKAANKMQREQKKSYKLQNILNKINFDLSPLNVCVFVFVCVWISIFVKKHQNKN